MREIEVTVRVNNSLKEIEKILKDQGFKLIENYLLNDTYMSLNTSVSKDNAFDVLSNSVIIRDFDLENNEKLIMITHKQKEYDNGTAISDTKIDLQIDDTKKAVQLFEKLNFKTIVKVSDNIYVYEKDGFSIAIEDVKDLGILIEYENPKDFSGYSNEEILKEKERMYQKLKTLNLNLGDSYDIKKAYELLLKKIGDS